MFFTENASPIQQCSLETADEIENRAKNTHSANEKVTEILDPDGIEKDDGGGGGDDRERRERQRESNQ